MFRRLSFFIIGLCVVVGIGFSSSTANAQTTTWTAQYFNNTDLSGSPAATATLSNLNINWGHDSPASGVGADDWTARFNTVTYFNTDTYRFTIHADDAVRLYVHGQLLIDTFSNPQPDKTVTAEISLNAGNGGVQVDFREYIGPAFLYVSWKPLSAISTSDTSNYQSPAWYEPQVIINRSFVNFRSEPFIGNNLIAKLPRDARYFVVGKESSGNWYQIQVGDTTGWVFAPLVIALYTDNVPIVTVQGNVTTPVESQATINTGKLNVRSEPFVSDNVITTVTLGDKYAIYGVTPTKDWYLIKVGQTLGWVSARYVEAVNISQVPVINVQLTPPETPQALTGYSLRSAAYLNIRSGPAIGFSYVSILPYNAYASIIARNSNNTWWLINYKGVVGWVSGSYVILPENLNYAYVPIA